MKLRVFILAAIGAGLLAFPAEGQAQSAKEIGIMMWNQMMQPDKNLDSTYVFQPFKGWNFSTNYKARWDAVGIQAPVEYVVKDVTTLRFKLYLNLIDDVTHHVGVGGGYGPINLGFSTQVGKKSDKKNRHLSFNWSSTKFNLQFSYSKIRDTGNCTMEFEGGDPAVLEELETTAKLWRVSGFYIFNNQTFSYPSAYTGKLVQRKSAGSILVGAKYLHGGIALPEKRTTASTLFSDLIGYNTDQLSIGAGYSFNWVLYHRDAETSKDIGHLNNLTFNITAIPLLTFVNEMSMIHMTDKVKNKIGVHGHLQPNVLGKVGLCYAFGHFYINCGFEYNYNIFRTAQFSRDDLSAKPDPEANYEYRLTIIGHLSNCVGSLELHYRF